MRLGLGSPARASPVGLGIPHVERRRDALAPVASETPPRVRERSHGDLGPTGYTDADFTPYPQPTPYNDRPASTFPRTNNPYNARSMSTSTFSIPLSPVSPVASSVEVWRTYARGLSILDTLDQTTEVSHASSGSRSAPSRRRSIGTIHNLEERAPAPTLDHSAQTPAPNGLLTALPDFHPPRPSPITSFRSNSTRSYRPNKLRKVLRVEGGWEMVRGEGSTRGSGGSAVSPPRSLVPGVRPP